MNTEAETKSTCEAQDKFVQRVNLETSHKLVDDLTDALNAWTDEYHQLHGENPTYAELGYWAGRYVAACMAHAELEDGHNGFSHGYQIGMQHGYDIRTVEKKQREAN